MLEEILSSVKQAAPYAAASYAVMTPLTSFVEWGIHKYLMHQPKNKRIPHINERQSKTHQDEHHGAYKAPKHYFQDTWNDNITSEFGWGEIAKIFFGSAGFSAGIAAAYNALVPEHAMNFAQAAGLVTGVTASVMSYYRAYETTHNWMHVLEKELYQVQKSFAHHVQDKPDGNALFPLPFMDNLSNYVINTARKEAKHGSGKRIIPADLQAECTHYFEHNLSRGVKVTDKSAEFVIDNLVDEFVVYETEARASRGVWAKTKSGFMNWVRGGKLSPFRKMHRHHYGHHAKMNKNLNVVIPIADYVLRTKMDTSVKTMCDEKNAKTLWICPYAPEDHKFSDEHPDAQLVPSMINSA